MSQRNNEKAILTFNVTHTCDVTHWNKSYRSTDGVYL
jgi:hypothetical protein